MTIEKTDFEGLLIIRPQVFEDDRGFFMESYNQKTCQDQGLHYNFVQDNHSKSGKHVLRGLHFQHPPHAQTKLIRVIKGNVQEVVVDLRADSNTFKKHFTIDISDDNKLQLLIPKGFAHGFLVLSDSAEVLYKCDAYYHPESEGGIRYEDPDLNIQWKVNNADLVLSEKDKKLPFFNEINLNF